MVMSQSLVPNCFKQFIKVKLVHTKHSIRFPMFCMESNHVKAKLDQYAQFPNSLDVADCSCMLMLPTMLRKAGWKTQLKCTRLEMWHNLCCPFRWFESQVIYILLPRPVTLLCGNEGEGRMYSVHLKLL